MWFQPFHFWQPQIKMGSQQIFSLGKVLRGVSDFCYFKQFKIFSYVSHRCYSTTNWQVNVTYLLFATPSQVCLLPLLYSSVKSPGFRCCHSAPFHYITTIWWFSILDVKSPRGKEKRCKMINSLSRRWTAVAHPQCTVPTVTSCTNWKQIFST